ncbi:MAG: DUF1298 domain-containing protein [Ilumatobacter sp.]|nr:DUF1298 domain-containing protein [Ilumatobacter sp.]
MAKTRDTELSDRMSEHEALMWSVEKDPWLNPSGGSLILLDRPMDIDHFRRQLRHAVSKTPRLYQRVVPGFGRLSTPAWAPDPEFDIDAHIREIVLPKPGSDRQLFDLAAQLYAEPLDRTRPLWRFVAISGLKGGRGAIWAIIHHAVSDGIGQMRMAEMYQQLSRDEAPPEEVDLEGIIAAAAARSDAKESGGNMATSAADTLRQSAEHVLRRQIGIGRRVAGEVAMWPADPARVRDTVNTALETVQSTTKMLRPRGEGSSGSPLWANRSRHRRLEYVTVPLDHLKTIGKAAGGSVNDVFMAALAEAASRYHIRHDAPVEWLNSSFVLSTRSDNKAGGNAFTPVPVQLPGAPMPILDRVGATIKAVAVAKEEAQTTGGMTGLSGIINLLPTSVITQTAKSTARRIDFATSNLRGAPFELYTSGAKVLSTIAMGPVAGTGANITALSYNGSFDIGIFADPAAITDTEGFRDDVEQSFADLLAAATT